MKYKPTNLLIFTGKFADLKALGFRYSSLHDNQAVYTTYETGSDSDMWIRKSMRLVSFDGYNQTSSARAIQYLIENNFACRFMMEDESQGIVKPFDWNEYQNNRETHRQITLKVGTVELLKKMYEAGMLGFKEFEVYL